MRRRRRIYLAGRMFLMSLGIGLEWITVSLHRLLQKLKCSLAISHRCTVCHTGDGILMRYSCGPTARCTTPGERLITKEKSSNRAPGTASDQRVTRPCATAIDSLGFIVLFNSVARWCPLTCLRYSQIVLRCKQEQTMSPEEVLSIPPARPAIDSGEAGT